MTDLTERLLVREAVLSCTRCELHGKCTAPVPYVGSTPNEIVVVGEAPGKTEDRDGAPFIGLAGEMIRRHLTDVGIDPNMIGWLNTVSCYPNGTPSPAHIKVCAVNKEAQLDLFDPHWVLLLGSVALKGMGVTHQIGVMRGQPFTVDEDPNRVFFATYHPAYALRNSKGEAAMHEDLVKFKAMIDDGNPVNFVQDKCVKCDEFPVWFDNMVPWGNCGRADCGLPVDVRLKLEGPPPAEVPLRGQLDASERKILTVLFTAPQTLPTLIDVCRSSEMMTHGLLDLLRKDGWVVSPADSGDADRWALSHRGRLAMKRNF